MNDFQLLKWDSELFGFNVANILLSTPSLKEFARLIDNLKKQRISLAYWQTSTSFDLQNEIIEKYNGLFVDLKTTYSRIIPIGKDLVHNVDDSIIFYSENKINNKLKDLSLQCGEHSRFRIDPNIPYSVFEELYKIWIEKSVSKELADDILVYHKENTIAGLVTLYIKNFIGHIGLIGVDNNYRGQGIGNKLIAAAINYFKNGKCNCVEVVTQGKNTAACALYEKNGFSIKTQNNFYHFWLNNPN